MKTLLDFAMYVSISAGMALAASSFAILAALFSGGSVGTALWAIPLAGLLTFIVSGPIGALASRYPSAPGIGAYLGRAFGRRVGFAAVILYLSLVGCLAGAESFVFARVVDTLFPGSVPPSVASLLVLLAVVGLNFAGLEAPLRFQLASTITLCLSVLALSILPLFAPPPVVLLQQAEVPPDAAGIASSIGLAVFLFIGFEWVTPMGRKPQHYERLIPLSMPVALLILVGTYWAFAASLARNFTPREIAATMVPQFLLGSLLASPFGRILAAIACTAAMATAFNASLMGGARLVYAMSREGSFPRWCSRISLRTGVPVAAVLVMGALAVVASLLIVGAEITVPASSYAAAVECFMYGALILAWLRVERQATPSSAPVLRPAFRPPFPRVLLFPIAGLMPALGIGALLGDRAHALATSGAFALAVVVATTLALRLEHRRASPAAAS